MDGVDGCISQKYPASPAGSGFWGLSNATRVTAWRHYIVAYLCGLYTAHTSKVALCYLAQMLLKQRRWSINQRQLDLGSVVTLSRHNVYCGCDDVLTFHSRLTDISPRYHDAVSQWPMSNAQLAVSVSSYKYLSGVKVICSIWIVCMHDLSASWSATSILPLI